MKAITSLLSVALAFGSAVVATSQPLTLETISSWNGSSNLNFSNNARPITQTMMLPSDRPVIRSMSWRFLSANTDPVNGASSLNAYFAEWENGKPVGAPLWSAIGLTLPATFTQGVPSSPTFKFYDLVLAPNLFTDPTKTYGMILIGNTLNSKLQVAINDFEDINTGEDSFVYGDALRRTSGSVNTYNGLITNSSSTLGGDWLFSQIVFADSLTPIPETGTVAVVFAGALVVGLGIRRRMVAQRLAAAQAVTTAV